MLKALIFDVDGTLADTEMAHLAAFNHAFRECALDWHWSVEVYTQLLSISGGRERLKHFWKTSNPATRAIDGGAIEDLIERLHLVKTAAYEKAVQDGQVSMRPGVLDLIHAAAQEGLKLAIATTTSPVNISALLRRAIGEDWRKLFAVVEDASTAHLKKPHPMVYLQTLQRLRLPAEDCIAFEDSQNGLISARAAGLATVITRNSFTMDHDFQGARAVLDSLAATDLAAIRALHHKR
ncbi:MAG: HAD family hydrolase [Betaproteobacteria bacterium]|nr:HAD family hydrolase [Betaproteobacteria bacterium]